MKPGKYDLDLYQGDTFRRTFRVRARLFDTDSGLWTAGDYIDLTGYTGKCQFRETVIATDVAAELAVTILDQNATPGGISVTLTPAQATALTKAAYKWDLQLTNPAGDVSTYLAGTVTVTQEVTHI